MIRERTYEYLGVPHLARITYKRMRNMRLRYDPDKDLLLVSVPHFTPMFSIDAFVKKYLPKVLKPRAKRPGVYDGNFLYVLGEKKEVGELTQEEIVAYYEKIALPYIKERVEYYAKEMGVGEAYKVRIRDMKRTYGSNSRKTKTLTFQARLMAFKPEIIDSVVIHELAHHFAFDHGKGFYEVVYRYCPNYDILRKELIHDRFEG